MGSLEDRRKPLDAWGKYFAVRHQYGHWRSAAVSGVYSFPSDSFITKDFIDSLKHAVRRTIDRHTNLCYGVVERTAEDEAHLYQLCSINWDDIIELHTIETCNGDTHLSEHLGLGHQHLFKDQHRKPGWKLVVLDYETQQESRHRVDILFFAHHAIADGTSCAAFHKFLFKHLQRQPCQSTRETPSSWPYIVPDGIPRPSYVEDTFPVTSLAPLPKSSKSNPDHIPWTSIPPFLVSIESYKSRATILTIPPARVTSILAYCRLRKITFTGLLHALLIAYLTKSIPSAQAFRGSTPLSMRRFTKISSEEIVDQVSVVDHDWSPSFVSSFRETLEGSQAEGEIISAIARRFQEEVKEEISTISETGGYGLRFVAGIRDLDEFCSSGVKAERRGMTYEISNVGVVDLLDSEEGTVVLERLVFSQCGSVAGAAFGCSVASVANGPLTLCLHWQEGAVDEELIEGAREYLARRLPV